MSIPPDNYICEVAYPPPWATTLPRAGQRDKDAARIVSLAPRCVQIADRGGALPDS
jgi:hypothetical protein